VLCESCEHRDLTWIFSIGYGSPAVALHISTSFLRRNPLLRRANKSSVFALDFFHSRFGSGRGGTPAAMSLRQIRWPLHGPSSSRRWLSWSWTEMASSSKCTGSSLASARGLLRWISMAAHSDLHFTQRRRCALMAIPGQDLLGMATTA
jgi:hypothetical protein